MQVSDAGPVGCSYRERAGVDDDLLSEYGQDVIHSQREVQAEPDHRGVDGGLLACLLVSVQDDVVLLEEAFAFVAELGRLDHVVLRLLVPKEECDDDVVRLLVDVVLGLERKRHREEAGSQAEQTVDAGERHMDHEEEHAGGPGLHLPHHILDVRVLQMRGLPDQVQVEAELPVVEVAPQSELTVVVLFHALLQLLDLWLAVSEMLVDLAFDLV